MIPDIVATWPRNCDYPLWRQFIRDYRHYFNEVIISFHETNQGEDYRQFVMQAMFEDHVQFVAPRPIEKDEDWRSVAINAALLHSYNAEWIWFTEQDFIVQDAIYWDDVSQNSKKYDILAVFQGDRFHPCSIFVKRPLLNKTQKNFGIVPDKYDHFHIFHSDIMALQSPIYHIERGYKHLNGLSHNMTLLARGEAVTYQIEAFKEWLKASLAVSVPLDARFIKMAHTIV